MSDLLNQNPEVLTEDILAGIPDYSGGRAEAYFRGLCEDDRELVQWYIQQGIGPHGTERYVWEMVKGYALVDPHRQSALAIEAAHHEINRIERYLELFINATDFFPELHQYHSYLKDSDTGETMPFHEVAWSSFSSMEGSLSLPWHQKNIQERIVPLMPYAHAFLDDPDSAPAYFDQARIIDEHVARLADSDLDY